MAGEELKLLIDIDLLLIKKGITCGMLHVITRYAKANKCMRYHDKDKESSCLTYGDVNYMYGQFLKTLPVIKFKCVKKLEQFNKTKIQNYNEKSKGYFLEVAVDYHKGQQNDLPFFPEGVKINKFQNLVSN